MTANCASGPGVLHGVRSCPVVGPAGVRRGHARWGATNGAGGAVLAGEAWIRGGLPDHRARCKILALRAKIFFGASRRQMPGCRWQPPMVSLGRRRRPGPCRCHFSKVLRHVSHDFSHPETPQPAASHTWKLPGPVLTNPDSQNKLELRYARKFSGLSKYRNQYRNQYRNSSLL